MTGGVSYGLRPASPRDIESIMSLERQGFACGIQEAEGVFLERIAAFPEGFLLFEERTSGKVLGYICSELWDFEEPANPARFALNHSASHYHVLTGTELYISSMTIDSRYRNGGLGSVLFEEFIERQAEQFCINSVILIVNDVWTDARHIYLRSGFREIGRIEGFFEPENMAPQTAIMMRKALIEKARPDVVIGRDGFELPPPQGEYSNVSGHGEGSGQGTDAPVCS